MFPPIHLSHPCIYFWQVYSGGAKRIKIMKLFSSHLQRNFPSTLASSTEDSFLSRFKDFADPEALFFLTHIIFMLFHLAGRKKRNAGFNLPRVEQNLSSLTKILAATKVGGQAKAGQSRSEEGKSCNFFIMYKAVLEHCSLLILNPASFINVQSSFRSSRVYKFQNCR